MRDLFFIAILGLMFLMAFKRPFLFVLAYCYIDIVAPQRMSYFLLNSIPISMIFFALAFLGYVLTDQKQDSCFTPRMAAIVALLFYCGYMTTQAFEPVAAATKWSWASKALFFAAFLPFTLHKRLRIEALVLIIVLCASSLIVTGGIKTALGGGGYGSLVLLVQDNSGLYEGSIISMVAIAIIPLILWLANHGTVFPPDWRVKAYAAALILACLLIPVGTEARTGLVCIGVLGVLLLRFSKRRFLYLVLIGTLGLSALPFLPSSFTERMNTIQSYDADESASTRLAVWGWTWDFVKQHPMGGGFDSYRLNKISYKIPVLDKDGHATGESTTTQVVDAGRAFHSSYFEMLGEHGFFGLIVWLFIHVGGVWRMEVLQRQYHKRNRPEEAWVAPLALALQNFTIIYLVGSLFVGVAFQPFPYMVIAAQIGLDSYLKRRRAEGELTPLKTILRRRPMPDGSGQPA